MEFRIFTCISLKRIYVHTLERTLTYARAHIHTYIHMYVLSMHAHEKDIHTYLNIQFIYSPWVSMVKMF